LPASEQPMFRSKLSHGGKKPTGKGGLLPIR